MHRITITLDDALMADIDRIIDARGYQNRSEAIRDLARSGMQQAGEYNGAFGDCVAALVYVYDHAQRDLSRRLVDNAHHHHALSLATLHVHINETDCMEVMALRGKASAVQHFADRVIAERGVRFGRLMMMPLESLSRDARKPHRHRV